MKIGRTLVITLLFVISVAVYLFQRQIDRDVSMITVVDEASRIFALDMDEQVKHIQITDPINETEAVLEFSPDGWMLTSPILFPADKTVAQGLIPALRYAAKQRRLHAGKDWAEYGLDNPRISVKLTTARGKEGTLVFGDAVPVGKLIYARWTMEQGYMLLPSEMQSVFGASLYSLREKRIFYMPPQEVQKVSIKMGPNVYQWKKEAGKWYWLEPVSKFGKEVPNAQMEFVLSSIGGLYIKDFLVEEEKTEAELGFYRIQDRIILEGGSGEEEIFYFGNELPNENAYYGMKEDPGDVILIDRVKVYQLLDLLRAIENEQDKQDKIPEQVMAKISESDRS